jgi:hypothetical protein
MKTIQSVPTVSSLLFDKSTAEINLETLKNSVQTKGTYGEMPASRPVQHFEFLNTVTDIFGSRIDNVIQEPIYVAKSSSKRIRLPHQPEIPAKEPCPIDRFVFERIATRISTDAVIKDDNDGGYSPAIGISYNDRGISVCMGVNVWVCSNMSIFGGKLWSTYGKGKLSYDDLINVVENRVNTWQSSFEEDMARINRLKEFTIDVETQHKWTAQIFETAIRANHKSFKEDKDLILNVGQTSRLTEELCMLRDKKELSTGSTELTAWDFVNAGTENMKPHGDNPQDLVSLYPTLEKFNSHVLELVG